MNKGKILFLVDYKKTQADIREHEKLSSCTSIILQTKGTDTYNWFLKNIEAPMRVCRSLRISEVNCPTNVFYILEISVQ